MVERDCTLERGAGAPDVLTPANSIPTPPPLPGKSLVTEALDTPKIEYWKLDGRKLGFGEWMRIAGGWGAVVGWTTKLLGINIVEACRVPKFDDSSQLRVEEAQIREEVLGKMHSLLEEFRALGFHTPLYIRMENFFNGCEVIRATLLHPNTQTLAQVSLCIPLPGHKVKEELSAGFLSAFEDSRYLNTSREPEKFRQPANQVNICLKGASLEKLWMAHERECERLAVSAPAVRVRTPEEAWSVMDAYERNSFEFHRQRKVYVAPEAAETVADSAVLETRDELKASGVRFADAHAELQKLQRKAGGGAWSTLLLLLVTFGISAGAGVWQWSWKTCAIILGVLLFHEIGHYVAMRVFGYRELRMFFVPLLGAAVTGKKHNVAGWKKAIVSLMGPVPGILLGAVLGVVALAQNSDELALVSVTMVGLNAMNLLPLLPLDGGWFWNTVLFCRNRWLEALFKVLAGLAGIGATFLDLGKLWIYLGIVTLLGVPSTLLVGKAASRIRRSGWQPAAAEDDGVPFHTAEQIFTELDSMSEGKLAGKALATTALSVFEKLNAHPPRWMASLGLAAVYIGSLVIAVSSVLMTGFYLMGPDAMERETAQASKRRGEPQPVHVAYPFAPGDLVASPAGDTSKHFRLRQVVGTMVDRDAAVAAFQKIKAGQLPTEEVLLLGQTLLIESSDRETTRAASLAEDLRKTGADILDDGQSDNLVAMDLRAKAPSTDVAQTLSAEVLLWAESSSQVHLVPPWQITDSTKRAVYREMCSAYGKIMEVVEAVQKEPHLRKLQRQSEFRTLFGLPGWFELGNKYRVAQHEAELTAVRKTFGSPESEPLKKLVAHVLRKPSPGEKDWADQLVEWNGEMQHLLLQGEPMENDFRSASIEAIYSEADTVTVRGFTASHMVRDLPAFIRYLEQHGCSKIQYGFRKADEDDTSGELGF